MNARLIVLIWIIGVASTGVAAGVPPGAVAGIPGGVPTADTAQDQGKQLFQSQCTACHSIDAQLVGPALAGVDKRRSIDWITHFVRSSQAVIKGGDAYAGDLFTKFNKIVMPDHPDLTDAQIKEIVAYIGSESKRVAAEKPPFPKLYAKAPAYLPLSLHNYDFIAAYLAAVSALVLALYFAVRAKELERERKGKTEGDA